MAWQGVYLAVVCQPLHKDDPQHQEFVHQVDLDEVGLAPLVDAETALMLQAQTSHWWWWVQLLEAEMAVALQNIADSSLK